jgi:hypothetical protein
VKNFDIQAMTNLADAAFRQAAEKVIQRAKEHGTPIIVWENGAVKELDPGKVRLGREKRSRRGRKKKR